MKYELTDNVKTIFGVTLHQIRAIKDFKNIKIGDLGGWIEKEDNLYQEGNAWVSGNAWVYGNARVFDDARIFGDAGVYGNASISGNAGVYGNASISGNARIFGDASISGNAWVYGNARIYGNACIYGNIIITQNPISLIRSDGWTFTSSLDNNNELVIIAGCRYFTFEEAREHWIRTRGGTPLGEETFVILDTIEKIAKIRGFIK